MKVVVGVGLGRWGLRWGPRWGLNRPCLASTVTPPRADSTWLLLRRIQAESGTRGLFAGERLCGCPSSGRIGIPWDPDL